MNVWNSIPLWERIVICVITGLALLLLLVGCSGDGGEDVEQSTWVVTHDPYGREWACLNVITSAYTGGGLFCVAAP